MKKIKIPKQGQIEEMEISKSVVVLGANGAGKTKLALNLYKQIYQGKSHLIGSHNKLEIGEKIQQHDLDTSEKLFKYGNEHGGISNNYRWSSAKDYNIIDDYSKVLSYLFANQKKCNQGYSDEARAKAKEGKTIEEPGDFYVERAQNMWNKLIGHRILDLKRDNVFVMDKQGKEYHGKSMSDGEKYALYVIAQVLCLEAGALIIVDEPEHYLNKGILYELWDLLEDERNDCKFLYITHDIDFAVSRRESKKIWLKSYENNKWDWEEIQQDENLPEDMVLRILGNKKKVLFTEGEKEGADHKLFSMIYEDYKVIPLGSCNEVIRTLKGINISQFSEYSFKGIIDRDFWRDGYLASLSSNNIFPLNVAEVENLFITKNIMKLYCELTDEDVSLVEKALNRIIKKAEQELLDQCSKKIKLDIKNTLYDFNFSKIDKTSETIKESLKDKLEKMVEGFDDSHSEIEEMYSSVLKVEEYDELLKRYNYKGFIKLASEELKVTCIKEKILTVMRNNPEKKALFVEEFKKNLPMLD